MSLLRDVQIRHYKDSKKREICLQKAFLEGIALGSGLKVWGEFALAGRANGKKMVEGREMIRGNSGKG